MFISIAVKQLLSCSIVNSIAFSFKVIVFTFQNRMVNKNCLCESLKFCAKLKHSLSIGNLCESLKFGAKLKHSLGNFYQEAYDI